MVVGIDLGTTYSVCSYVDKNGVPQILDNKEGSKTTPSVVFFDGEDSIVVGEVAKDNSVINGQNVVSAVKNYMGKKKVLKKQGDIEYTPEVISSFVLKKVVQDAECTLGEKVTGAVVTVPAYFTDSQRMATKHAAKLADLNLLGMINEPTAAALCYVKKQNVKNSNIMIYDLGGGTFDVTILHIGDEDNIEVLSTGGLSNAGGRFFDQYIVDYVVSYMDDKHDIDLEDEDYCDELQELYIKAENAKIQLTNRETTTIVLKVDRIKEQIELSRELFEGMIKKVYLRTESKMKDALKQANLSVSDIDKVLLVGGSSRIPYIVRCVEQFTGKEPSKEVNPDEAVAMGAAIYAEMQQAQKKTFKDVCSHSIGIVVKNRNNEDENEIIISRNSTLPVEKEERFRTIVDNQKMISLTVTEGEYKEVTDVTIIGNFDIDIPKSLEKGSLVLIKISLDQEQMICIHLELPDANFEREYHVKRKANLDDEELENITGIIRDYKVS